ncbi:MAG: DNA polymerase III subunit delta' [Burkholderiales bacterium]|nr:DNA polymerase III subunit delta' [Burkholderiales bacterium]
MAEDEAAVARPQWPELLPWQQVPAAAALGSRATWPHALLIGGTRGLGKRTLAMNFARSLLCEAPDAGGSGCGVCASCHYMTVGAHPDFQCIEPRKVEDNGDVKELDAIPVDHIRAMIGALQLTSHRRQAKVVVIDPAEALNASAANALLKTLEEPPPDTYLLLVSHQPGRMPATLRSRCRRMQAPMPDADSAQAWLAGQAVAAPGNVLAQAGGAPLAALAIADPQRQRERAHWLEALSKPKTVSAVTLAARIDAVPKDQRKAMLGQWIDWLGDWTADLARVAAGGAPARNPDFASELAAMAGRVAPIPLFRYHRSLLRQRALVAHPLQPRLVVEMLLIGYRDLFR